MIAQSKDIADYSKRLLVFICLGHFCVDFMLGIWPVFKTMAGLDIALAGFLAGSCVVFGECLQCVFGTLSDKGYQRALLFCGIAFAACASLFTYVDSYLAFGILFMTTCLGSAAFHPTAASLLSGVPAANKSTIMGLFTASGMLGLGISQLLFSWTYGFLDGSTAILALPSLVLALAIISMFKGSSSVKNTTGKFANFGLFLRFLKVKGLRALYLTMLGNQIILWALVFLLPDLLKERHYSSWVVFGGGHLFLMIGATCGPPLLGLIADRTSVRQVIIAASSSTLVLFYLFLLPANYSQSMLFSLLFALGVTLGSVPPLVWSLGGQLVPQYRGAISAFLMGFVWIFSEGIGLGLSGYLASFFTADCAAWALCLMGGLQVVSCLANVQIPKQDEPIIA